MSDPAPGTVSVARWWRFRVFLATGACYAGFYFCRKPFYVAKATLEDTWGWSPETLGWLGLAYLVAYTVGQFLAAWSGTRWGPRHVLLAGMATSIACNVVFGLTSSLAVFAAFMVVNGLAQASGWANVVGTMGHWFRREERGTVMGVWGINYQVGSVAANALAGALLVGISLAWAFYGGGLVLGAALLFFFFNQRNRPEDVGLAPIVADEAGPVAAEGGGWTRDMIVDVALVGAFYFCVKFVRYALWSWTPYLLSRNYALPADQAGYLSTVFDVTGLFGVIFCGFLSDRVFKGRRAGVSLAFIAAMAAATGLLYLRPPADLTGFAIYLGVIGFTLYGPDALMAGAGAIDVGSPKRAVAAAGIINGLGSVGSVFQEVVLGRLFGDGAGVRPVFATLLGSSLLAAAFMSVLVVRGRRGRSAI